MALPEDLRAKIDETLRSNDVVLFMKGSRHFPQCGFSAAVVQILDKLLPKYATVNVLSDPAIREGIKEYSQWPTIPQLYVKGKLVGGCDIVKEMFASGELQSLLGVTTPPPPAKPPKIVVSERAARAIADAAKDADPGDVLHLEIDAGFKNDLYFGPKAPSDLEVRAGETAVYVDPGTAPRAEGLTIDLVEGPQGSGFKITNPNEPPRVRAMTVKELAARRAKNEPLELIDVRGEAERQRATMEGARPLDHDTEDRLASLPKDATLVFVCHHGIRSRNVAEQALRDGFTNVWNLEGGIDAWSREVDPKVPRY